MRIKVTHDIVTYSPWLVTRFKRCILLFWNSVKTFVNICPCFETQKKKIQNQFQNKMILRIQTLLMPLNFTVASQMFRVFENVHHINAWNPVWANVKHKNGVIIKKRRYTPK